MGLVVNPRYATLVAPIVRGQEQALRCHLRRNVEPSFDAVTRSVRPKGLFRFDQIRNLHFCSFVILDGDSAFDPYLVFEATFDGPRDDFLRELLSIAPEGVHSIYECCQGYPESGLAVPELVKDYLAGCDVGVHAFYSGAPGRSVAQVQGESRLREEIVTYVCGLRSANALPATLAGLQHKLQNELIRNRPENRWVELPIKVPWEVAGGRAVIKSAVLATIFGLGILVLALLGQGPFGVFDLIKSSSGGLVALVRSVSPDWGGGLIQQLAVLPCAAWFIAWLPLRTVELSIRSSIKDPSKESFGLFSLLHLVVFLRYGLFISVVGTAALAFFGQVTNASTSGIDRPLGLLVTLMLLAAAGLMWIILQYCATSLKLTIELREVASSEEFAPRKEALTAVLLDVVQFAQVAVVLAACLMLASHLPSQSAVWFASVLAPSLSLLLVLAVFIFVGALTAYGAGIVLLLMVRGRERAEGNHLAGAIALTERNFSNSLADAREDGGINRWQNHLASLTYVKPGLMRRWLLRLTLRASALLTRFWFNKGTLAEIPTILSARWVMIDGGRRLLFLSNYCGAWGSYLSEFTDMGAKSVNAIWTNTFVKLSGKRYAFPETKFYIWKGAHSERAFKTYVRQSQVETIVWYSAYPTLSVRNINVNSDMRHSLFKRLTTCELDALFHNL
jgi:hypothetical protein